MARRTIYNTLTWARWALLWTALVGGLGMGGCGMMGHHTGVVRPDSSAFGYGPRASAAGLYTATIAPAAPLRTGRMQRVTLTLRTRDQAPVEGATIVVDGGMPQHGHGLPTSPRVTRSLGEGAYQVEGVKFNMGGWWELKFRIASAAGTDSVTFNLDL